MLKSVHALVGTDLFLQLETLRELLAAAPPDFQRVDVDGETAELADVLDELRSFALFSTTKVLVVRDADKFLTSYRSYLEQYVGKPTPGSTLILRLSSLPSNQRIHKLIAAAGQIHDCNAPKRVGPWIITRARNTYRLTLAPDAAQLLEDLVGRDLGRLDSELAKLALQYDGRSVDAQAVRASVAFQREQEMWDMTNEVAAGNITAALSRWRHMVQLDSSAEFRAVIWLTLWLEKVRKAIALLKQGRREFEIGKALSIWPADAVGKFVRTAGAIGEAGANSLITQLAELDRRTKSGLGDASGNVERFLLAVGQAI